MININSQLQRLQWLREWMNKRIDNMALPYEFSKRIYSRNGPSFEITKSFDQYCAWKLHKQMINN